METQQQPVWWIGKAADSKFGKKCIKWDKKELYKTMWIITNFFNTDIQYFMNIFTSFDQNHINSNSEMYYSQYKWRK